jgi:hypothetical protein
VVVVVVRLGFVVGVRVEGVVLFVLRLGRGEVVGCC